MARAKGQDGKRRPALPSVQERHEVDFRRRKNGQFAKRNRGGPGRPRKPPPEPPRSIFKENGSLDVDAILGDSEGDSEGGAMVDDLSVEC
jgi:hypothetical protein